MRRLVNTMLALTILASLMASTTPAGGVAGFGDVDADRFFTKAVQWMVDNGITTGTSPTCFSPDDPVTRGQAAAFMWRMEGFQPPGAVHPFDDVVAAWQQDPVSWMFENQITTGTTATTYSPEDNLTRGQLAALLHRLDGSPAAPPPTQFVDVVKPWQIIPVGWLLVNGITTGTSPSMFSPDDVVTRGQLATFFYRYKSSPPVMMDYGHPRLSQCPGEIADLPLARSIAVMSCSEFASILNFDGEICRDVAGDFDDEWFQGWIAWFSQFRAHPSMCAGQFLVTSFLVLAGGGDIDMADRVFATRHRDCADDNLPETHRWTCSYSLRTASCSGDIGGSSDVESWSCEYLNSFGEVSDPADRRALCSGGVIYSDEVYTWECDWSGLVGLPAWVGVPVGDPVLCNTDFFPGEFTDGQWFCEFLPDERIDRCWSQYELASSGVLDPFTCKHFGLITECGKGASPPGQINEHLFSCYWSEPYTDAIDPMPWIKVDCAGSFSSIWAYLPVPLFVPL